MRDRRDLALFTIIVFSLPANGKKTLIIALVGSIHSMASILLRSLLTKRIADNGDIVVPAGTGVAAGTLDIAILALGTLVSISLSLLARKGNNWSTVRYHGTLGVDRDDFGNFPPQT